MDGAVILRAKVLELFQFLRDDGDGFGNVFWRVQAREKKANPCRFFGHCRVQDGLCIDASVR